MKRFLITASIGATEPASVEWKTTTPSTTVARASAKAFGLKLLSVIF